MRTSADNVSMNDGSVYQVPYFGPPFKFHNLSRYVQELFGIVPFVGFLIKLNRTSKYNSQNGLQCSRTKFLDAGSFSGCVEHVIQDGQQ